MSTIVIYRLGSLGDTVVALPCFHRIAETFPQQRRIVLTNLPVSSKAAPLDVILRPGGFIDGVIAYPVGLRSLKSLLHLRRELMQTGSRTLIYLAANRGFFVVLRDVIFFRLCGFKKIIGAPLTPDLRNNRIDSYQGKEEPEAERLVRTMRCIGDINLNSPAVWDLRLTPEEIRIGEEAVAKLDGAKFFAVNMGGKESSKDWGEKNWSELITTLLPKLPSLALVVVGTTEDTERGERLMRLWPYGGVNLCGLLSPRESASVLAKALFFVGHDSGPLHLAATVQTPCVGLFGDFNRPCKWHPYGSKHHIIHDLRGIEEIGVQQVVDSILSLANSMS